MEKRTFSRLKSRRDFLRVRRQGQSRAGRFLVLQSLKRRKDHNQELSERVPSFDPQQVRFGYTATKKLGSAVVRNRAKRRMRALAEQEMLSGFPEGHDFVLIARYGLPEADFKKLKDELGKLIRTSRMNAPPSHAPESKPDRGR